MWNFRFTNLTKFIVRAVAGVESQPPSSPLWPGPSLVMGPGSHWAARATAVINHISELEVMTGGRGPGHLMALAPPCPRVPGARAAPAGRLLCPTEIIPNLFRSLTL